MTGDVTDVAATTLCAGFTEAEWKMDIAAVLAPTKVRADADALADDDKPVDDTPEQRCEARHKTAAAMAVAGAPTRPNGANRWSKVDALTEGKGVSLCGLGDTSCLSHLEQVKSSQAYIAES